jgi:hypothetical protein
MRPPVHLREGSLPADLTGAEVWAVSQHDDRRERLKVLDAAAGLVEAPSEAGAWNFELVWPRPGEKP